MMEPIQNNSNVSTPPAPREAPVSTAARSGLTGRLTDSAIFQSVKHAVEDATTAGTRWFSQPIRALQAVLWSFGSFFGGAILREMNRREERQREEKELEQREESWGAQRLQMKRLETEAQEKRRKPENQR